jgi:hypothetical protein
VVLRPKLCAVVEQKGRNLPVTIFQSEGKRGILPVVSPVNVSTQLEKMLNKEDIIAIGSFLK